MMKDLQNYTSAIRDVGLNSTPMRSEAGTYRWSNGQLEILNIPEYNEIRNNKQKIDQLNSSLRHVAGEILAFETPVKNLEAEGHGTDFEDTGEINDHKIQLHQYRSSLSQLDKDLLMRGYIPPGQVREPSREAVPPLRKRITVREVMSFLLIWFVGEVFMTYVQWNSLRDGKGMEDMVVRSISFGVVLFLIHLVGKMHEEHRKNIHKIFLIFSFVMLFTMLLAPLVLNEMYPPVHEPASASSQWSLTEESANTGQPAAMEYPFWVNFYRNNDMMPGILVFLFFVIMQTFVSRKKQEPEPKAPASRIPESAQHEIEEKRQYFLEQISHTENRIGQLENIRASSMEPNTRRLEIILSELQSKQSVMDKLKLEKNTLSVQNDRLIKKLEMHLNRYHTEFLSVLQNDPVKSLVLKPEWPTTADLKAYFALN